MTSRSGTAPTTQRKGSAALLVVLVGLVAAACAGGRGGRGGSATTALPATPLTTLPQPPGPVKAALKGLLDRRGEPPAQYLGTAVNGWVIQAYWKDLQPAANGVLATNNAIDQAIARARQLNNQNPSPGIGLKLRVYAGIYAPDWAKNTGGPAITVVNPQSNDTATIGRFWTEPYGQAYNQFMQKLAAQYDTAAEIHEVVISRCTTFFAEPFIRDKGSKTTVATLLAAGFTRAADDTCHHEQIDTNRAWQHTRSDLELNPYQDITQRGANSVDETFTEDKMRYCRTVLATRCVLENNSLRAPPKYPDLYAAMTALGPPIAFQTETAKKGGDLQAALQQALTLKAGSVELPVAYTQADPTSLAPANHSLQQAPG